MSIFFKLKKNIFIIVVAVMILYVVLLLYSDLTKFSRSLFEIDYRIVPVILSLMSMAVILLAFRFYRLVRILDVKISFKKSILIYFVGLSFGITPGGAGTIIKSQVIKSDHGVPISRTGPIIFIEKWNELNSVLLILIVCIAFESITEAKIIAVIGTVFSLLFLGVVRNKTIFSLFKSVMIRMKLSKYEEMIENSQSAFKILTGLRITVEGLFITTAAKIIEAFSIYLTLKALKIHLDFIFSTQIYFTSILSGVLSFIPGGLVVTEGSMLGLLVKYGTDFTLATVSVMFVRLVTIWYTTILGLITTKFIIKYKHGAN